MGGDKEVHVNIGRFLLTIQKETHHDVTSKLQKRLYVVDRVTRVRVVS